MPTKYSHTNIIAKDYKTLVEFYVDVLGCVKTYPERDLKGQWLDALTGIEDCKVKGMHLKLPGYEDGPTLEIFSYEPEYKADITKTINAWGFAHIAFHVDCVEDTLNKLTQHGGKQYGELIRKYYEGIGELTAVYAGDPEGNLIEIQNWGKPV